MFERFGTSVVGVVLYSDFNGPATTEPKKSLYEDPKTGGHAAAWLTEQYDRAKRKETWSITMVAAITLLVAVELIFSILNFASHKG